MTKEGQIKQNRKQNRSKLEFPKIPPNVGKKKKVRKNKIQNKTVQAKAIFKILY